jgi:hypothetical protein
MTIKDITGQRFGRLVAQERAGSEHAVSHFGDVSVIAARFTLCVAAISEVD